MGFLDKVKQQAEQAAAKAKDAAEDVQAKRELGQAYGELGQKTYDLVEAGTLSNPELDPIVERIRSIKAKLEDQGGGDGAAAAVPATDTPPASAVAEAAEPAPSDQPPAMPT
jgi:hypothetical protein